MPTVERNCVSGTSNTCGLNKSC